MVTEGLRYIQKNDICEWQADKVAERVLHRIDKFWRSSFMDPPDPELKDFKKTSLINELEEKPLSPSRERKRAPELFPPESDEDLFG